MPCDLTNTIICIINVPLSRICEDCDEKDVKFLGLLLDEHLTWKHHIAYINKKISRALFSIKQVKKLLPLESLKTLYHSLVNTHLSYGILVWGHASQSILRPIILSQKRAIRMTNNANIITIVTHYLKELGY